MVQVGAPLKVQERAVFEKFKGPLLCQLSYSAKITEKVPLRLENGFFLEHQRKSIFLSKNFSKNVLVKQNCIVPKTQRDPLGSLNALPNQKLQKTEGVRFVENL